MFGSLVEGEDGEDEGVSDEAGAGEKGLLHGEAGRGGAVEAAHGGELGRGEGRAGGGGDGDGGDGDGDVARVVESEIFQENEGAGIGGDFEGLDLWF